MTNVTQRSLLIIGIVSLMILMACVAYFISASNTRDEIRVNEPLPQPAVREYSEVEHDFKTALSGEWFYPYSTYDCANMVGNSNTDDCTAGVDGHTLLLPPEQPTFDSATYECGWDVQGDLVTSVCGSNPQEILPWFRVISISDTEMEVSFFLDEPNAKYVRVR